ncbi:MAG: carbohydrate ABC transporter substrate-binding protein, partial [Mesorhizobium sp.]
EALLDPKTQVAFNLKKGSLPVRGDIDLKAANDCMKKGLDILAKGSVMPWTDQLLSQDTQKQKEDLLSEFFAKPDMTVEEAQKRFADIVASAD